MALVIQSRFWTPGVYANEALWGRNMLRVQDKHDRSLRVIDDGRVGSLAQLCTPPRCSSYRFGGRNAFSTNQGVRPQNTARHAGSGRRKSRAAKHSLKSNNDDVVLSKVVWSPVLNLQEIGERSTALSLSTALSGRSQQSSIAFRLHAGQHDQRATSDVQTAVVYEKIPATHSVLMAPEIKFTSFGIPYLVEFANVTFRRKKRNSVLPPLPPPKRSSFYLVHPKGSDWTLATTSSATLAYPNHDSAESEGRAMYIRFASEGPNAPIPGPPLSDRRMAKLLRRLGRAVLAVGMDQSGQSDANDASVEKAANKHGLSDANGALYRGTYGQVMQALQAAGLTSTLCDESALQGATRLGLMFIIRPTGYGGVELSRVTLFA
ncbi:hypothetical protein NM688_g1949 [Phlebia brevispora]|uniref:Uncharacterized protein n=1 Tax=Phlebia brevispora TaxID=194682 RepID=A0ACC1TA84_9APHY|nr:hypothetical protein NM688_g1949 [Phlebia brevispora]